MCIKEIFGFITVELELPKHLYGIEKKNVFLRKSCLSKLRFFKVNLDCIIFSTSSTTLDSGIDVAPGINVAHGTFGKNIKRSP